MHTHSVASYDGGISQQQYQQLLHHTLDIIAITDHNTIDFALAMHKKLGDSIIVGEEIASLDGEVIGLFLSKLIPAGLSLEETIRQIHKQKGLVYIPHPFEHARSSITYEAITAHAKEIDILEVFNARSFGRKKKVISLDELRTFNIAFAASSDAHCSLGIGTAYASVVKKPSPVSLKQLLALASLQTSYAPLVSYLCPFINKISKKILHE